MGALGLVQLQGVGDAVQHGIRCAGQVAALHPHVVVDADAGQQGYLFAPQTLHAAVAPAVRRQSGLVGSQPCAPGDQEVADLRSLVGGLAHALHRRSHRLDEGGTAVTWNGRHCPSGRGCGFVVPMSTHQ